MATTHRLANLVLVIEPAWFDVTAELGDETAPFTLARNDGIGVLQFSVATYRGGKRPDIDLEDLKRLLLDFAESRELGTGTDFSETKGPTFIAGRSFDLGRRFIRVWYCSDGTNLALVTYSSESGVQEDELRDCARMVAALRFDRNPKEPAV